MKRILFFLALMTSASYSLGEGECVMRVLGRYCLGGLASSLPRATAIQEGDLPGVVFRIFEGGEAAVTYNGKIYKVAKVYDTADFNTYNQVYAQLNTRYGKEMEGLKIVFFPPGATEESTRLEAIRSGKGKIQHVWRVPDTALISLRWEGASLGVSYENPVFGPRENRL